MLKQIIESTNLKHEEIVALCIWKNNLVVVPCDNCMSGYYARYKDAIIIKKNVDDLYGEIQALLLIKTFDEYEAIFATDSWDGFQPTYAKNINDFVEFIKWISIYI